MTVITGHRFRFEVVMGVMRTETKQLHPRSSCMQQRPSLHRLHHRPRHDQEPNKKLSHILHIMIF